MTPHRTVLENEGFTIATTSIRLMHATDLNRAVAPSSKPVEADVEDGTI